MASIHDADAQNRIEGVGELRSMIDIWASHRAKTLDKMRQLAVQPLAVAASGAGLNDRLPFLPFDQDSKHSPLPLNAGGDVSIDHPTRYVLEGESVQGEQGEDQGKALLQKSQLEAAQGAGRESANSRLSRQILPDPLPE